MRGQYVCWLSVLTFVMNSSARSCLVSTIPCVLRAIVQIWSLLHQGCICTAGQSHRFHQNRSPLQKWQQCILQHCGDLSCCLGCHFLVDILPSTACDPARATTCHSIRRCFANKFNQCVCMCGAQASGQLQHMLSAATASTINGVGAVMGPCKHASFLSFT